jgi:transposase
MKKKVNIEEAFLIPKNPVHRQYEALRSFYVDKIPSKEAAKRFGYTESSFRVLCHNFRKNPARQFFLDVEKGPQSSPKMDLAREKVIELRKTNLSIYDIKKILEELGTPLSAPSISAILKEEGFSRLPRRADDERPLALHPEKAAVANVRHFQLEERHFKTKFGGLFLFLPFLIQIPFDDIFTKAGFPGTEMIPAGHAMRSLLALKLFGHARHSHVMSYVFDEGLALFAGLNIIPKRSFLTEYSCRINPIVYPKVMQKWFEAISKIGLESGVTFDLDFHTIPFHGEEALIQKHYVSKRSRSQKGLLAFVVWDSEKKHFCFADANVRRESQNDQILRFVEYWKEKTGRLPKELVFDSRLTTHQNLSKLNDMGIQFITLRRRTKKMLAEIQSSSTYAWRQIQLDNVSRAYRNPRILDQQISLKDYNKPIRQIAVADLGHEEPTIIITNQLNRSPKKLVDRYARRMIIENGISDAIDFFHMDALSSSVAMKVDCDLQLTLMASSLYRIFAGKIGHGYETAEFRHIFRDFIDATASIFVSKTKVVVRFHKKAHNPFLLSLGLQNQEYDIPWWGGAKLRLEFG